MRMRSYLKKKNQNAENDAVILENLKQSFKKKSCKMFILRALALLLLVPIAYLVYFQDGNDEFVSENATNRKEFLKAPEAVASVGRSVISIPVGVKKEHPFVPYRSLGEDKSTKGDVPSSLLMPPPEELAEGSDAARLLDTIVSGILYDKYSPSAILNIEGNDYLVKKVML